MTAEPKPYQLADCYRQMHGRVYMTGTQALVRVLLDQSRRAKQSGLNTGGFVSGYRGSPLGGARIKPSMLFTECGTAKVPVSIAVEMR